MLQINNEESNKCSCRGFTIIELLVVVSIIAILAGIIIPTFYYAKRWARVAAARNETKYLEAAFISYLDNYKVWPTAWPDGYSPDGPNDIKDTIFTTLRGDYDATLNPQSMAFFDFSNTNAAETIAYDPWADPSYSQSERAKRVYQVMFDKDYDNKITINGKDVYRCVLVWSPGEGGTNDYGEGDDVASWK